MKEKEKVTHPPRVLIYGHEIGGQMQLLAESLRRRGVQATAAAVNEDFRRFRCDVQVGVPDRPFMNILSRWSFALFAVASFDVFHFFWGVSLLGFWRWHLLDLPLLRLMKKRVVVHFRGLDIVDISTFDRAREMALGGDRASQAATLTSRPDQMKKLRAWRRRADVILVSEPDLWDLVPEAVLSPQVVDMEEWRRTSPKTENGEVTIVHAPTNRRKKGTEFVIAACEALRRKGLPVRLLLIENMPYSEVRNAYECADIAVDQVLYGWHGKFSLELMAMGVPVVCYIRDDLLSFRPDLPIVNATPANLADVLEALIRDKERRRKLAAAGPAYVRKYHGLEVILDQLMVLYGLDQAHSVASHWFNPARASKTPAHAR